MNAGLEPPAAAERITAASKRHTHARTGSGTHRTIVRVMAWTIPPATRTTAAHYAAYPIQALP
jgi:hypothetical protein